MKKMLCMLLVMVLCPVIALAEDSAAEMLTWQELSQWAESYISLAWSSEPLNNPAESQTPDGYEYVFNFATLYADTPTLSTDTTFNAIVLTSAESNGPRNVNVNSALSVVLDAYYTENAKLLGSHESAVLYTVDMLPDSACWAQVLRDGQRVQTVQYAVHEQLATGGEGYTDAGVIYTLAENRVAAVRVYGLNTRISKDAVNEVMFSVMLEAVKNDYAMVPFSYDGASLTPFSEEDLVFSGMDFLALTPDAAIALLGEPMSDLWLDNGESGYIRMQTFPGCEVTYLFNKARTEGQVYMLSITADSFEGPRAARIGDAFSAVYNRFRNGEGEYQEDGTEALYGVVGEGSFGQAVYGSDASAILRYVAALEDGRKVTLHLGFTVMECTEILLYVE